MSQTPPKTRKPRFFTEEAILDAIKRAKKNEARWRSIAADFEFQSKGLANSYYRNKAKEAETNAEAYALKAKRLGIKLSVFRTPLLPGVSGDGSLPR